MLNQTLTVRRISYGEGVERVFPIHSPRIAKIEVETAGTARRAKLNYLRARKGKSAMAVREKVRSRVTAGQALARLALGASRLNPSGDESGHAMKCSFRHERALHAQGCSLVGGYR